MEMATARCLSTVMCSLYQNFNPVPIMTSSSCIRRAGAEGVTIHVNPLRMTSNLPIRALDAIFHLQQRLHPRGEIPEGAGLQRNRSQPRHQLHIHRRVKDEQRHQTVRSCRGSPESLETAGCGVTGPTPGTHWLPSLVAGATVPEAFGC